MTINKMAILDSLNIASFDVKQVLNYPITQQQMREGKTDIVTFLSRSKKED